MTKYSLAWLQEKYATGERLKYIFFWGHKPHASGRVSKSCFSQWWENSSFSHEGVQYATAEHWMMAEKARLFEHPEIAEQIVHARDPGKAKALGRMVEGFSPSIWDSKKIEIVVAGNFLKFNGHENLKRFLLDTKERVLVEASPVDRIWGIGLAADHQDIENPYLWKGQNLLGFALMEVRDMLRSGVK